MRAAIPPAADRLLHLQSAAGNQAVLRMLQRQSAAPGVAESVEDREAAARIFDVGAKRYEGQAFGHAYDAFMRSYALVEHPDILLSAAQALRRLGGRGDDAAALYERYLAEGGTKRKQDAETFVAKLRAEGAAP